MEPKRGVLMYQELRRECWKLSCVEHFESLDGHAGNILEIVFDHKNPNLDLSMEHSYCFQEEAGSFFCTSPLFSGSLTPQVSDLDGR